LGRNRRRAWSENLTEISGGFSVERGKPKLTREFVSGTLQARSSVQEMTALVLQSLFCQIVCATMREPHFFTENSLHEEVPAASRRSKANQFHRLYSYAGERRDTTL